MRTWLLEFGWRFRLNDAQACRLADWRCRWFPYRVSAELPDGTFGPWLWQWPDVFEKAWREP